MITSGVKPMVDKDWLKAEGYDMIYHKDKSHGAYCFADPRVFTEFRDNLVDNVKQYGIASYKFDWGHFKCGQDGHRGHLRGEEYGFEAGAANFRRVHQALRQANPDIFLFNTGWYSPWWLWTYDAVFSAGADYNFGLAGPPAFSTASLLCTWRDATIRGNLVRWSPFFPLNSLMTVDPISYWWHEWEVRAESPLRPFTDYFLTAGLRGTQMTEIYNNISAWSDEHADAAVAILKWMKANDDVILASTRYLGGDPLRGEPYGYAHFTRDNRGILVVRNPDLQPHSITVALDESTGMWPDEKEYVVRRVYPSTLVLSETVKYGSKCEQSLSGHEVCVFEVWPTDALPEPMPVGCRYQVAAREKSKTTFRLAASGEKLEIFSPVTPAGGTPVSGQPRRYVIPLGAAASRGTPETAKPSEASVGVQGGRCVAVVDVPEGAKGRVSFLLDKRAVRGEVTLDGKPVAADAPHVRLPDAKDRQRGTKAAARNWSLFGVDVSPGEHEIAFQPAAENPDVDLSAVRVIFDVRTEVAPEHTLTIGHEPITRKDEVLLPQNWAWQARRVDVLQP